MLSKNPMTWFGRSTRSHRAAPPVASPVVARTCPRRRIAFPRRASAGTVCISVAKPSVGPGAERWVRLAR